MSIANQPANANEIVMMAKGIRKSYGSVHALKGVDFIIHQGKVTTLFGENGAGKSTLMKILAGIVKPCAGEITLNGHPLSLSCVSDAQSHGISIIHQELNLAPNLTVRDNIFMGREIRNRWGINYTEEARQTNILMEKLEEDIDPLTRVEALRLGQQQLVEIARALSVNARILIMDEPTSALSASEVKILYRVIHDLTNQGVSIVYISHHLEEALYITDYAVVLRDGAIMASAPRHEINLTWIIRNMVGKNFHLGTPPEKDKMEKIVLNIDSLSVKLPADRGYKAVNQLSLTLKVGEIVCIYGLMGAGRTELMECIAGRLKAYSGKVILHGKDISAYRIAERIQEGLVLVPEDRQRDGLIQTLSVGKNLSLASIKHFIRGLLTSTKIENCLINKTIANVTIKTDDCNAMIGTLSGGNQQKVVIGKMLATHPQVVLLDEPCRGIDVGAKAEVFKLLAERAKQGLAILYTTSELNECLSIAHKIVVMRRGTISAIFDSNTTKEAIMAASGEAIDN
ncbi:MAG: sugar ABC transporter ATP-binding protein [Ostreibacterium sp.]